MVIFRESPESRRKLPIAKSHMMFSVTRWAEDTKVI